jgi:hypothetical protein
MLGHEPAHQLAGSTSEIIKTSGLLLRNESIHLQH